ncbi:MAG: serine hydrolase [Alphaproteobacteria bacterium]|nr:serine hydrolase [Alphaproteobacteria bacterium]
MRIDRREFLGVGAASGVALATAGAAGASSTSGKLDGGLLARVRDYAEAHMRDWGLPGMTIALSSPDGQGFVRVGMADLDSETPVRADHLYQVGSITKMMTGLAFWTLVDEGRASPDALLKDMLPELKVDGGEAITLLHLLNHTSGLPGGAPLILDDGLWVGFAPGASWEYCNLGFRLIGKIIERIDGRPFPDAVEARVLRPIGMTSSKGAMRSADRHLYAAGYQAQLLDRPGLRPAPLARAPWVDFDASSGCIASTAADMAKFAAFLVGLGRGDGAPVLSADAAKAFLASDARARDDMSYASGVMKLDASGRRYLHHTGGMVSFSSSLHVDPEAGVGAFASTNIHYARSYRPRDVTKFACELMRAAMTGEKAPTPPSSRSRTRAPERFAGEYASQSGVTLNVVAEGDQLKVQSGYRSFALQPVGDLEFATDDPRFAGSGLDFELADGGAVRVWAGSVEFLAHPDDGYRTPFDGADAYVGHYATDDRWGLDTKVYVRGTRLHVKSANYGRDLVREGDGWRFVGAPTAARIAFDGMIGGQYQRVIGSGEPSYRVSI